MARRSEGGETPEKIGSSWGRYTLSDSLGPGPNSHVYEAVEGEIGRRVALKIFAEPHAKDANRVAGLLESVKTAAAVLNYPGIVTVFEVRKLKRRCYYTTALAPKGDLSKRIGKLSPDESLDIIRALAKTLTYAHGKGIVHGNIKPTNVLFHEDDRPLLTDFGLVPRDGSKLAPEPFLDPHYASPEQARGDHAFDASTDLYSLGVLLFECLTGSVPFSAETTLGVALRHVSEPVPSLPRSNGDLQKLLDGLMAKQPKDRLQSAGDVVALIDDIQAQRALGQERELFDRQPADAPRAEPSAHHRLGRPIALWSAGLGFGLLFLLIALMPYEPGINEGETVTSREEIAPPVTELDESFAERSAVSSAEDPAEGVVSADASPNRRLNDVADEPTNDSPNETLAVGDEPVGFFEQLLEQDTQDQDALTEIELASRDIPETDERNLPVELEEIPPPPDVIAEYRDILPASTETTDALDSEPVTPDLVEVIEDPPPEELVSETQSSGEVAAESVEVALVVPPIAEDPAPAVDIDALLSAAEADLQESRLTLPVGNNALEKFRAVLSESPNNARAQTGLMVIERSYLARADARMRDGNFVEARTMLARASLANPDSIDVSNRLLRLPPESAESRPRAAEPLAVPETVVVLEGAFTMGTLSGDNDERPPHRVRLSAPIPIFRNEVTVGDFKRFVDDTGYSTRAELGEGCYYWSYSWRRSPDRSWRDPGFEQTDNHPVVCIAFRDALAYADWISGQTGVRYRLPTETEWEYVARGGQGAGGPWGQDYQTACNFANVSDQDRAREHGLEPSPENIFPCSDRAVTTSSVGAYAPNAFGLQDILGNASEWVADCWHDNYRGAPTTGSAWVEPDCDFHIVRGGNWSSLPDDVRAANRLRVRGDEAYSFSGFRLVREYR